MPLDAARHAQNTEVRKAYIGLSTQPTSVTGTHPTEPANSKTRNSKSNFLTQHPHAPHALPSGRVNGNDEARHHAVTGHRPQHADHDHQTKQHIGILHSRQKLRTSIVRHADTLSVCFKLTCRIYQSPPTCPESPKRAPSGGRRCCGCQLGTTPCLCGSGYRVLFLNRRAGSGGDGAPTSGFLANVDHPRLRSIGKRERSRESEGGSI